MPALVLDSEALSRLAHGTGNELTGVRLALTNAARRGWPVRVPSVVLAELDRSPGLGAAIDSALHRYGVQPMTTGRAVARGAGRMLSRDRLDTCHLVDAVVVATAVRSGGGVVVTGDPDDLEALAADEANVRVLGL